MSIATPVILNPLSVSLLSIIFSFSSFVKPCLSPTNFSQSQSRFQWKEILGHSIQGTWSHCQIHCCFHQPVQLQVHYYQYDYKIIYIHIPCYHEFSCDVQFLPCFFYPFLPYPSTFLHRNTKGKGFILRKEEHCSEKHLQHG